MSKHIRILGWLHIAMGVFDLLLGLAMVGLFSGVGVLSGDPAAFGMMTFLGGFIGTLALVVAIPNFIVGVGLLRDWGGWVLVLAVVLALLNATKVPWGTAVAIYTGWIAWRVWDGAKYS